MHVKKGDKVKILIGKDRGKTGAILLALPEMDKVVVEGVNMFKKHRKGEEILERPMPIHVSNVAKTKAPESASTSKSSSGTKTKK